MLKIWNGNSKIIQEDLNYYYYFFQIFQTRAYTSTLFESYASPPVCEAREAETEEQDHLKHTILLILLAISMFTGKFLKFVKNYMYDNL